MDQLDLNLAALKAAVAERARRAEAPAPIEQPAGAASLVDSSSNIPPTFIESPETPRSWLARLFGG